MARARALGRALDQPGDVGEHELALAVVDRAEHRLDGRERIVGDLRRAPASARASSEDLPAFGRPTSPASASSFRRSSIQPDSPRRPRSANRGACRVELAKRLLPCPPSAAARRRPRAGPARSGRSARRRPPPPRCPAAPGPPGRRRAPRAAACPCPWLPRPARNAASAQRGQVAPRGVADQHDVAAAPAVAAVGPAARHVRLAPEADAAVAAAAALDPDPRLVVEHAASWQAGSVCSSERAARNAARIALARVGRASRRAGRAALRSSRASARGSRGTRRRPRGARRPSARASSSCRSR